jgi:hypothetical protein
VRTEPCEDHGALRRARRRGGAGIAGPVVTATVPRVALRWPDEVAAALGVSRSWLYDSGLAAELRFVRNGKVRLVLVAELERVIEHLSARWDG